MRFLGKGTKSWIAVGSEDLRASGRRVLGCFGKQCPDLGSQGLVAGIGWLGTTLGLQLICDHGYGHDKIEIHFLPTGDEGKRK